MRERATALRDKLGVGGLRKASEICDVSRTAYGLWQSEEGCDPANVNGVALAQLIYALELDIGKEMQTLFPKKNDAAMRLSRFLKATFRDRGLDPSNKDHVLIFALGPGSIGEPNCVWRNDDIQAGGRLWRLMDGDVAEVRSSDCGRLSRCLTTLTGEFYHPNQVRDIALGEEEVLDLEDQRERCLH